MDESDLELPSRRDIYQTITDTPGIHFRELLETLDYAQGTIQYHLRWLANENLIEVSDDANYTRYYPAADFDDVDQTLLNALRRKYSRRILAHLVADGPLSTSELSDRLDKADSTISWHLSKLSNTDLVTKERNGRRVLYTVTDPSRVTYLYTIYRQSFTDRVVDRMLDLWDDY